MEKETTQPLYSGNIETQPLEAKSEEFLDYGRKLSQPRFGSKRDRNFISKELEEIRNVTNEILNTQKLSIENLIALGDFIEMAPQESMDVLNQISAVDLNLEPEARDFITRELSEVESKHKTALMVIFDAVTAIQDVSYLTAAKNQVDIDDVPGSNFFKELSDYYKNINLDEHDFFIASKINDFMLNHNSYVSNSYQLREEALTYYATNLVKKEKGEKYWYSPEIQNKLYLMFPQPELLLKEAEGSSHNWDKRKNALKDASNFETREILVQSLFNKLERDLDGEVDPDIFKMALSLNFGEKINWELSQFFPEMDILESYNLAKALSEYTHKEAMALKEELLFSGVDDQLRNLLKLKNQKHFHDLVDLLITANLNSAKKPEAIRDATEERKKIKNCVKILMKIFGTIIDQQYYAQSFLKNNLTSSKPDNKKIENEVVKEIITRAQIFLDNNLPLVKESWDNIGIVDQKYTEFSKAAFLFATTFKIASEKEGVEFSDIKNTSYEIRLPDSLTEADKVRMEGMFIRNRVSYKKELLKETLEDLRSAINGEKQSLFYMLEHDKELVAYMRFDPIEPGRVYAGSLNVRDEARGSRLGSAMLQATLEEQGLTADIEAVAYSKNPMLKHYIDDFGFEIVGEIPDYHGTGELFYKLLRKKKQAVPAKSYTKTP